MNWKDFEDAQDYSGLLNAVRSSKTTKMTLVVRAFITVPKEDFEAEIEPALTSQRVVYSSLIGVDNRLLQLSKSRLWHHRIAINIQSNLQRFKIDGDVQLTMASTVTNDTIRFRPQSMLTWIPPLCLIGHKLLSIKRTLSTSTLLLVDQNGTRFSTLIVVKAAVRTHHSLITVNLRYMCTYPVTLHVVLHVSTMGIRLQHLLVPQLSVDDVTLNLSLHHPSYSNMSHGQNSMEMD